LRRIETLNFGGQTIFPVYGESGGLPRFALSYLYVRGEGNMPDFDKCELPSLDEGYKIYDLEKNWLLGIALVRPHAIDDQRHKNVTACYAAMAERLARGN